MRAPLACLTDFEVRACVSASSGRAKSGPVPAPVVSRVHAGPGTGRHGSEGEVMEGVIVNVISDRGFGFVRGDDGRQYFFHCTAVQSADFDALQPRQRVAFDIESSERGPRATAVRLAAS